MKGVIFTFILRNRLITALGYTEWGNWALPQSKLLLTSITQGKLNNPNYDLVLLRDKRWATDAAP